MKIWIKGALIGGALGGILYVILVIIFLSLNLNTDTLYSYGIIDHICQLLLRVGVGAIAGTIAFSIIYKINPKYFSADEIS